MTKRPIRVKAAHPSAALHRASRVNYGAVYTVAHSVRVKAVGLVHVDSMLRLIENFEKWDTDGQSKGPEVEKTESAVSSLENPCIERALEVTNPENSRSDASSTIEIPPDRHIQKGRNSQSGSQPFETAFIEPLLQDSRRVRRSSSLPSLSPPNRPRSPV